MNCKHLQNSLSYETFLHQLFGSGSGSVEKRFRSGSVEKLLRSRSVEKRFRSGAGTLEFFNSFFPARVDKFTLPDPHIEWGSKKK